MKQTLSLILCLFTILALMSGCRTSPTGPPAYQFGQLWSFDNNSAFGTVSAEFATSYCNKDGQSVLAPENCIFFLVSCQMNLSNGWELGSCVIVGSCSPSGYLYSEPVQNSDTLYTLVFCVDYSQHDFTSLGYIDFDSYDMQITFINGNYRRTADFSFSSEAEIHFTPD